MKSENIELVKEEEPQEEKGCLQRLDKKLIPYKLFYFFFGSSYGSIQPYLTLFFKQLWLPASSAGVLFGMMHLCQFTSGWFLSAIADKYQKRKLFLIVGTLTMCSTFFLVSFAPYDHPPCIYPNNTSNITRRFAGSMINQSITTDLEANTPGDSLTLGYPPEGYHPPGHPFSVSFIYLLVVISFGSLIYSVMNPLSDTLTLQALEGNPNKIGRQRATGGFGYGFSAFLIGAFLSLQPRLLPCFSGTDIDFKPSLYFGCFLCLCGAFTVCFMKEKKDDVKHTKKEDLWICIRASMSYKIAAVFLIGVYCGAMKSIIDSFLFWRLQEINGKQILNSLIKGLQCISEFIGFIFAEYLIKRLGHFGVMYIAVALYATQFLIYVLIQNPWLVFLSEWMQSITFAGFLSAGISYIGLCPGAAATMQAFFSTGFMGLGFGIGPMLGGLVIDEFGIVGLFSGCCGVTVCVLIVFIIATQINVGDKTESKNMMGYKEIIEQSE